MNTESSSPHKSETVDAKEKDSLFLRFIPGGMRGGTWDLALLAEDKKNIREQLMQRRKTLDSLGIDIDNAVATAMKLHVQGAMNQARFYADNAMATQRQVQILNMANHLKIPTDPMQETDWMLLQTVADVSGLKYQIAGNTQDKREREPSDEERIALLDHEINALEDTLREKRALRRRIKKQRDKMNKIMNGEQND